MKYAFKKARMVRVYDIATGEHKATLDELKTSQFTGSQETVYAEGAEGRKLAAFDLNKVAGYNATNGAIETKYLALQIGGKEVKVTNGTDVMLRKTLKTDDGTTVTMPHKAHGEEGNEIGFIYSVGADQMPDKAYAQAAAASATEFAYDPDTNKITLPTGVFKAGDQIVVDYYPKFATYTQINNESDKFAMVGRVVVDAWFTDICTELDVPLQVVLDKGKISGEIDLSYGDQAAVQNIAVEAMGNVCGENKTLWRLFTYDEEEIIDT